jgi:hypothetical protein
MLAVSLMGYAYNDRTMEQLRSSGNYRLIRKKNVTDSLIKFDTRMRGTFTKNYNNLYDSRMRLMTMQTGIMDLGIWGSGLFDENRNFKKDSINSSRLSLLPLLTNDRQMLLHYYNMCLLHLGFNSDVHGWAERMKLSAVNLIQLIQKEYKLE